MITAAEWAQKLTDATGRSNNTAFRDAIEPVIRLIQQNAIESASKWLGSSKVYYSSWTVHHDCQQDCAEKLLEFIPK